MCGICLNRFEEFICHNHLDSVPEHDNGPRGFGIFPQESDLSVVMMDQFIAGIHGLVVFLAELNGHLFDAALFLGYADFSQHEGSRGHIRRTRLCGERISIGRNRS